MRSDMPSTVPWADDDGVTLVELIVAAALSVIALLIIGGFFTSWLTTSTKVVSTTQKTTDVQLAVASVSRAVANASGLERTNLPGNAQFVVARTAGAGASESWHCQAWYYSGNDGGIYTSIAPAGTIIAIPTATPGSDWTLLASGIEPLKESGPAIDVVGKTVKLRFISQTPGNAPVMIKTTVRMRNDLQPQEDAQCF